jgi:hypothetical protein
MLSGIVKELRMQRPTKTLRLFGAALALFALTETAHAQSLTTFASVDTLGQVFQFVNSGSLSTFGVNPTIIPITFKYKVANGYGLINTDVAGTMTLTANVTSTPGGFAQQMNGVTMSINANTPLNGKTNLLTMTGTGRLTSFDTADTANFGGNTNSGFIVGYTSDFLDFSATTARSFNFALNSLTPQASLNGNGYMDPFTASGLGNFAANPSPIAIPEPGSLALLALATLPVAALVRRRRS